MNYAVGDWCFFEFELGYVKRACSNGSYSIGNGVTECSGSLEDRMFPLDYRILQISQHFEYEKDALRRETEPMNLNWPDIHGWLVDKWVEACKVSNNEEALRSIYKEATDFCRKIRDDCRDLRFKEVAGVRAFSRR